jgi:hypothetical protein
MISQDLQEAKNVVALAAVPPGEEWPLLSAHSRLQRAKREYDGRR